MWDIVLEAFEYSAKNTSTIDPQLSLYDFFEEKVKERFPDATKHEHQRKIVMQFSRMWGAMVGSPVYQQSLKYFWLEECIEGGSLPFFILKLELGALAAETNITLLKETNSH